MIEAHLRKLRYRDEISEEEVEAIRGLIGEVKRVRANETVIRSGEELTVSTLVLDGWLARVRDLSQGQRQITEVHVPGDFADLHSFTLKRLEHNVIALTPARLALVPHDRLRTVTERYPHLTWVYWFSTNLDAAIQREWAVSLGRRSALQRIAHLFCELRVRLSVIGMTDGESFNFPLRQTHLSECLGMTPVHLNRTLQELRGRGLVRLADRRLTILDWDELQDTADFDPAYLYLERKPR